MAKNRAHGEGSVFHRKDGRWVGQVTIGGKHLTKYAKTQREAREWLRDTTLQVQQGMTLASATTTLDQFLEHWLSTVQSSVRPSTYSQYRGVVRNHILPLLGKTKLKDLRPDQIQNLYNQKLRSGISPRSVQLIHAVLHHSLNQALRWGIIGRNPTFAVTRPKGPRHEMQVLNDTQVRNLLLAAKGTRWEVLFQVAITTGLRQGEILGLKWGDLDWKSRKLHIQRQVQRLSGKGHVFSEPKSAASRRVISVGEGTLEKLREHSRLQQLERLAAGEKWKENDLIFPSIIGTPLDCRNLLRVFKGYLHQCGLPELRFHDLRHSSASLMLLQGIHPKVVQERLGHSQITMTLAVYSHILPSMQDEAAQKIDELVTPIEISGTLRSGRAKSDVASENNKTIDK